MKKKKNALKKNIKLKFSTIFHVRKTVELIVYIRWTDNIGTTVVLRLIRNMNLSY